MARTKPPRCRKCRRDFANDSALRRHMRDIHEGRKVYCEVCPHSTARRNDLNKHYKSAHSFRENLEAEDQLDEALRKRSHKKKKKHPFLDKFVKKERKPCQAEKMPSPPPPPPVTEGPRLKKTKRKKHCTRTPAHRSEYLSDPGWRYTPSRIQRRITSTMPREQSPVEQRSPEEKPVQIKRRRVRKAKKLGSQSPEEATTPEPCRVLIDMTTPPRPSSRIVEILDTTTPPRLSNQIEDFYEVISPEFTSPLDDTGTPRRPTIDIRGSETSPVENIVEDSSVTSTSRWKVTNTVQPTTVIHKPRPAISTPTEEPTITAIDEPVFITEDEPTINQCFEPRTHTSPVTITISEPTRPLPSDTIPIEEAIITIEEDTTETEEAVRNLQEIYLTPKIVSIQKLQNNDKLEGYVYQEATPSPVGAGENLLPTLLAETVRQLQAQEVLPHHIIITSSKEENEDPLLNTKSPPPSEGGGRVSTECNTSTTWSTDEDEEIEKEFEFNIRCKGRNTKHKTMVKLEMPKIDCCMM